MAADELDRLLTTLAIRLHACSVCQIQHGWGLAYSAFDAITIHFVLVGQGALRVGTGPVVPFAARSALVVPAHQPHILGGLGPSIQLLRADEHCSMLGDGLVSFTAGDGSRDVLMLCGMISASHNSALGLFELLREPLIQDFSADASMSPVYDLMLAEVTRPGLGTQAMTEVLMKQCLIALLRQHLLHDAADSPLFTALHHPRLARAVLAILDQPAALHSVGSLADLAGMSRASFAEHFSSAFQQGPIDFVQKVRLRIAARLLTTTDLPLKIIAQTVGYASHPSFTRAFNKSYGVEPVSYRRSNTSRTEP
ncbi:MAG: helix-turn-helix domain-containing protein [Janthinobacterium lividum]